MPADESSSDSEVILYLEGEDLYVRGDQSSVDLVLADLLGPDESKRRGSLSSLAVVGAFLASAAATKPAEGLYRLNPSDIGKLAQFGGQYTGDGALSGFVRAADGKFAGNLSFKPVTFGPEQALAVQTAAVTLALRMAIADVQAAVEAVDEKVSDIQKKIRSREVGEIVGTHRFLQRVVDSTRQRGRLLEADWDQAAGARRDLEIALESLRAYVMETINEIDTSQSLPDREEAIKKLTQDKGAAGSLRLIVVAEQALHLMEYLRLERIRTTNPEDVLTALVEAREFLAQQRARDDALVQAAVKQIEAARKVGPLEVRHVIAIPQMAKTSELAFAAIETFATSTRTQLPEVDKSLRRPELAESREELKRQAVLARDGVVGGSRLIGSAVSRGAGQASGALRKKLRERGSEQRASIPEEIDAELPETE